MAAPTVITVQAKPLGPFAAITAGLADFTFAAGTVTDGDTFACTGRELLIVNNTNIGTQTVTIVSVDDETNRSEDITIYSLASGDFAVFGQGLTNSKGWKSTAGTIRITVSHAEVKVAVLQLPAGYPE